MAGSPSILLIDDDPRQIKFLSAILRRQGYKVFAALDGRDGLAKAAAHPPDLILLDLFMPEVDGQATIRLFKAHPTLHAVPVICLTVSNHIADKLGVFEAGAVDYVTKPFVPEEIVARVRVHLRLRQAGAAPRGAAEAQDDAPPAPGPSWEERMVAQAQGILMREMAAPPALAELARRVGTTERHLSHEFRRQVGQAVFAWLREERLREACTRLLHTGQQLSRIGTDIGYQSAAAFSNAFRKRFRMTPSEYRKAAGITANDE